VLSDPQRRARYDRTGSTEESIVDDAGFDWTEYYRTQFAEVVTNERIEEIKREYQGSDEEKQDVLKAYTKYKGDLDKLLETVLLSDVLDDEARFKKLIETAIEAGEVQAWDKFTKETDKTREKRRKRALKEKREAERFAGFSSDNEPPKKSARIAKAKATGKANGKANDAAKANDATKPKPKAKGKGKPNSMNDLAALIQQRQAGRTATTNAFFDSLEEKYGGSAKGSKGKQRAVDEPPEEAFAEMAKRARKGA
jgi:DnaJ homolog subfamily C member 9